MRNRENTKAGCAAALIGLLAVASAQAATVRVETRTGEAIQEAIDCVAQQGGGRVVVPAGTYPSGTLQLRSNVDLHLEKGAVVQGPGDGHNLQSFPSTLTKASMGRGLVRAWNVTNVTISGDILLGGTNIRTLRRDELRRRVGLVFQTPTPFPMSIRKNITYAPQYYGVRDKTKLDALVRETLELAGLYDEVKDELDRSALRLSGGQQQRLCIARALTVEPEVLLLDEPCSALDVKATRTVEQLLLRLKERYTVIIVTHNLAQARRIADRTVFLYNGQVVEEGETERLFTAPQREETRDFLSGVFG